MIKNVSIFCLFVYSASALFAVEYYYAMPSGMSRYKLEAARQLVGPQIRANAAVYTSDERISELIATAYGLDSLLYDGVRLVRFRGALVTNDALDDYAIARAVHFFNVTPREAKAWLLASRLLQFQDFKDEGVGVTMLEQEICESANDIYWRLATYFGEEKAIAFLPHFRSRYANTPMMSKWQYELPKPMMEPKEKNEMRQMRTYMGVNRANGRW
jgi:hypothetical protein